MSPERLDDVPMMACYLNGRVLGRPVGGVRRYAAALDERLNNSVTLRPRSVAHPWSARMWEQTTLARLARDGVLLNPAHAGPLAHRRQVSVVHDLLALHHPRQFGAMHALHQRVHLPRLVAASATVIAVSRSVADDLIATLGRSADSIEIAPPGIEDVFSYGPAEPARALLRLDASRPVVGALLGRGKRKNNDLILALLRQLAHEHADVQTVVAGSGDVSVHPPILKLQSPTDANLADLYRSCDVFVSLTAGEGFGLPVIEAALCGAAIVTTPVPSIVEYAPELAVVVSNPDEALQAVRDLLADPKRLAEQRAIPRTRLGDLRWEQTTAIVESVLTTLSHR